MAEVALLRHLHGAVRGGADGFAGFDVAATQLHALTALRERDGADAAALAEELVDRAEQLVGSKQAASRLMGMRLLHSMLANCDRRTFMQRHMQWAAALLAALRSEQAQAQQAPSEAAAEACSCLAAYFARVGRMLEVPGMRRDGSAAASKLVALLLAPQRHSPAHQESQQPTLQQQQQPAPLLRLLQGQQALLAALHALPAACRHQQKALEQAVLPLLMGPGSSGLLAACAAALPRITGDGAAWSAFCQRLLITAHCLGDLLLLSLDDRQLAMAGRAAADPAAEPLPLPAATAAGGAALSGEAYVAGFGKLAAVLQALLQLLSQSYPSAVPVPTGGLVLLVSRLLSVDDAGGGGGGASGAATANARFPQLRLQLPALQAASLRLLSQLLATSGAAGTPYFVAAARLLGELLQRSAAPGGGALATSAQARRQLYATAGQLLTSAGGGVTRHLAPALLQAAAFELYGRKQQAQLEAGAADAEGPARKKARKGRQTAAAAGDAAAAAAAAPLDDLGSAVQVRDMAVQVAVLQALESLVASGAPLLTPHQRQHLDDTAAHLGSSSSAAMRQLSCDAEAAVGAGLVALHAAALRLLLATLLSPAPHRPQHLSGALRLFQGGCGTGGSPQLAAFCRQALLSCEALLHPRSLPPPAPLRTMTAPTPAADGDQEGGTGQRLGMPRFWSSVDASLLLQQEAVSLQRRQQQQHADLQEQPGPAPASTEQAPPQPGGALVQLQPQPPQQQQPAFAAHFEAAQPGLETGGDETEAVPPAVHAVLGGALVQRQQQPQQQQQQQQAPVAAGSSMAAMLAAAPGPPPASSPLAGATLPLAQAAIAPAPAAAAAAAAAAVAAAAAEAEGSDSEGSLPEIDSGEGSSSDSDMEAV